MRSMGEFACLIAWHKSCGILLRPPNVTDV
jgi:hypothetical protein